MIDSNLMIIDTRTNMAILSIISRDNQLTFVFRFVLLCGFIYRWADTIDGGQLWAHILAGTCTNGTIFCTKTHQPAVYKCQEMTLGTQCLSPEESDNTGYCSDPAVSVRHVSLTQGFALDQLPCPRVYR